MTKKPHEAYIVLAVCNFDDVMMGVYATLAEAKRRARQVFKNPDLIFESPQPNDTGFICTRVYKGKGTEFVEVAEFSEQPKVPA